MYCALASWQWPRGVQLVIAATHTITSPHLTSFVLCALASWQWPQCVQLVMLHLVMLYHNPIAHLTSTVQLIAASFQC